MHSPRQGDSVNTHNLLWQENMAMVMEQRDLTSYVLTDKEIKQGQDTFRYWMQIYSILLLIL